MGKQRHELGTVCDAAPASMTKEQARDLFHSLRLKAMLEYTDFSKPVIQDQADLKAWEGLLEAHRKEIDAEWAMRLIGD